ncbi:MAG: helix-turn-helix transcriptional regulator [Ktedonobacteraceae bacterium]
MEKNENKQIDETTEDIIAQELTDVSSDSAFVSEYLKAGFLSSAVDSLFNVRRQADFTQAQVAEQMNTKQAAIARWEADADGSMSLRRYVEFALACGMVPLNIVLVPIESVQNFVIAHPDIPLTQVNYDTWLLTKETPSMVASRNMQSAVIFNQSTVSVPLTANSSVQHGTENSNPISYTGGSEEQANTNQYRGRLAA